MENKEYREKSGIEMLEELYSINGIKKSEEICYGGIDFREIRFSIEENIRKNGLERELKRFSEKLLDKGRKEGKEAFKRSSEYGTLVRNLKYMDDKFGYLDDLDDDY